MDNVKFVDIDNGDGTTITYAIIDKGDGNFTSMLKTTYDEMIANQASGTIS